MDASPAVPSTPATTPLAGWRRRLDALGDRANPILVRIVRQELRSRGFVGVFTVLLVAAVIAAIVVASFSAEAAEGQAARGLFAVLAWAWSFALCLVQPTAAFRTVSNERNEDTWDLVELTGMRPRAVLGGLFAASAVQGLMYTSALAPFMLMAYLLRGLDLIAIAVALVIVPMAGAAATALAVFAACLGTNKPSRALLGGLLTISLTLAWLSSSSAWFGFSELARFASAILTWTHAEWLVVGAWINAWAAFIATMLVLAATLLTFRAANRSTGPRLLGYGLWANLMIWAAIGESVAAGGPGRGMIAPACGFVGLIWAGLVGLFAITEDYELSPRQARSITEPPRPLRPFTGIFGPGAARGRWCWLVLSALSFAVIALGVVLPGSTPHGSHPGRLAAMGWALIAYLAMTFAICDALYRGPLARLFPTPPLRRGFTLLAFAVASIAPTLVLMVVEAGQIDHSAFGALSPIHGLVLFSDDLDTWSGTYALVSIGGVVALAALMRQGLRLAIRTRRVRARADERDPRGG